MARKRRRAARSAEAKRADVYRLYQEAVQDPEGDVALVSRIFKRHYGRAPRLLREDFCGTAAMACAWVRHHRENCAWGIDLDPEPLAWGQAHNIAGLDPHQAERIHLIEADVLDARHAKVDATVAFNFSYFIFKTREQLVRYFEKARSTLREEGILVLDLYGGADAQRRMAETREYDHFDYVWDQDVFDPIHHNVVNYIHFEFADGSRLQRAFRYDWRLWSIPEVRDALLDAGFSKTEAYWEQTDRRTNEGNGTYYRAERAEDDPAWVAYVVGLR
ncbi:MAG: class I SAM-dependent methyltransferase [Myxococcales bacterium]|nr:class I SAM-dependent methyltransferase [Myxococcales bacterium]MDH5305974.1 class I SAM-dependent methyltransferase [Myxococcales bacterium]MDH5567734.1 class I SAM-dependent methyltransferase [Myxococcales bacterium]